MPVVAAAPDRVSRASAARAWTAAGLQEARLDAASLHRRSPARAAEVKGEPERTRQHAHHRSATVTSAELQMRALSEERLDARSIRFPRVARCDAKWPEGITADSAGKTCALQGPRKALEAALADAGTQFAFGPSAAYSVWKCISPRIVAAEPHAEGKSLSLEFDRTGGRSSARSPPRPWESG